MKARIVGALVLLQSFSVLASGNNNPEILKTGDEAWYHCVLTSAEGAFAIAYFPVAFDMILGLQNSKTDAATSWSGHLLYEYRDGSKRLKAAEISQSSGFVDHDPQKGFVDHGWLARDVDGYFQYVEHQDTKTGWFLSNELISKDGSGLYSCKITEPVGLAH